MFECGEVCIRNNSRVTELSLCVIIHSPSLSTALSPSQSVSVSCPLTPTLSMRLMFRGVRTEHWLYLTGEIRQQCDTMKWIAQARFAAQIYHWNIATHVGAQSPTTVLALATEWITGLEKLVLPLLLIFDRRTLSLCIWNVCTHWCSLIYGGLLNTTEQVFSWIVSRWRGETSLHPVV